MVILVVLLVSVMTAVIMAGSGTVCAGGSGSEGHFA